MTWETCCQTLTCYELKTLILGQCLSRTKLSGIRKTEFRRQPDSNISKLHDLLGLILVICKMTCSMQSRVLWYSVDKKPLKRSIKIQSTNRRWKENILNCSSIALRLQVGVKPWTKGNIRWAQRSSHQQTCYSQRLLHPGEIPEKLKGCGQQLWRMSLGWHLIAQWTLWVKGVIFYGKVSAFPMVQLQGLAGGGHRHTGAGKCLFLALCTRTGGSTLSGEVQHGPWFTVGNDSLGEAVGSGEQRR